MSAPIILVNRAGSLEHQRDARTLAAAGLRLPVAHRPDGRPAPQPDDLWCSLWADEGTLLSGVVVGVRSSRKLPWLRLGRIRHASHWLRALLKDRSANSMVALRQALRAADGRLARVSVHAYDLSEMTLEHVEELLVTSGWRREPAEREYQRTSIVPLDGDPDALAARMARSARLGIRKVERFGLNVCPLEDPSFAGRLQFLHEQAHERTGGNAAEVDLAAAVAGSIADPTGSVVFGVFHPERRGGGALIGFAHGVVTGDAVLYATAGTERAPDIGAAPMGYGLVWAMMLWGQQLGLPWFDFGGITPEDQRDHPLARISEFKRRFRGQEVRVASDWYIELAPVQNLALTAAERVVGLLRR